MNTGQRRQSILRLLADGISDACDMGAALHVSVSTIRRDLARMADEGLLLRTYGGAAVLGGSLPERSVQQRASEQLVEKAAIAAAARAVVQPGEVLILDAGTTTGALARLLVGNAPLRVVTNGLGILQTLADAPDLELVALGGTLRSLSGSFVGPQAEAAMRLMSGDRAFLGADGIVAGRGICEATDAQVSLKQLMAERAAHVYVLATADKLGRAASHAWMPLVPPWTLVTDARATEAQLAPFRREGVAIVVARGTFAS